jgi:hypothetical protein
MQQQRRQQQQRQQQACRCCDGRRCARTNQGSRLEPQAAMERFQSPQRRLPRVPLAPRRFRRLLLPRLQQSPRRVPLPHVHPHAVHNTAG